MMAAIHPQNCDEVKVDIPEQQQEKKSVSPAKKSDQKSMQTLDSYSYKQIFGVIILCVSCEIFSIGLKHICTVSQDTILFRYHIIGSGLMIGAGFFGILFVIVWPFYWLQGKPIPEIFMVMKYHCVNKDESSSISWWQKKRFTKIILVICILIFWLAMFEIGRMFYIIADYIKDKPVLEKFIG